MGSTSTPSQTGHTSTGHPTGMWSTLPTSVPINPIHAALLHTGKILLVSGSGNCPPTLAGCPSGPQYPQGAALMDLATRQDHPDACRLGHVLQRHVNDAGRQSVDQRWHESIRGPGGGRCAG